MSLDTEPTLRLPVVEVPSATIATPALTARARHLAAQRARRQARWDLLARILSYLCFGSALGLLIGFIAALGALALTLADQDGAVPALESTTTATSLTLPPMPSTAFPLLGGVAHDTTTTAAPAATTARTTPRPTTTSTTSTARQTPPVPTTTATTLPSTTETAATTAVTASTSTTEPPPSTSTTTAPVPTDPSTTSTSTEPAPPATT